MFKKILSALALAGCALSSAYAETTYDTQNEASVESEFGLFFPFGETNNDRYQLWFSSESLAGNKGKITSISNYLYVSPENDQWINNAAWDVEIWASSTTTYYAGLHPTVTSGNLNGDSLDENLGVDAVKIYDGKITLTKQGLTFQTIANFEYFSGNLLLDYRLKGFYGGIGARDDSLHPNVYNGPTFQVHTSNDAVAEIISNTYDGEGVYKPEHDYSLPLRTSVVFQSMAPVPEPEAWLMLLAGLSMIGSMRRRQR